MKFLKPFMAAFGAVLVLDTIWWFVNLNFVPAYFASEEMMNTRSSILFTFFMLYDPTVVIPWIAIGLLVAIIGWLRVRSLAPGLMVSLGALLGTAVPWVILTYVMFTSCCEDI